MKSVEAFEPERLVVRDPVEERSYSIGRDPVIDEAAITPLGHQAALRSGAWCCETGGWEISERDWRRQPQLQREQLRVTSPAFR